MMDLKISTELGGGSSLSWCNTMHYVVSKRLRLVCSPSCRATPEQLEVINKNELKISTCSF